MERILLSGEKLRRGWRGCGEGGEGMESRGAEIGSEEGKGDEGSSKREENHKHTGVKEVI